MEKIGLRKLMRKASKIENKKEILNYSYSDNYDKMYQIAGGLLSGALIATEVYQSSGSMESAVTLGVIGIIPGGIGGAIVSKGVGRLLVNCYGEKTSFNNMINKTYRKLYAEPKLNSYQKKIKNHSDLESTILEITNERDSIIDGLDDSVRGSCCYRHSARRAFKEGYDLALSKDSAKNRLKVDSETIRMIQKNPEKILDAYLNLEPHLHSYCNTTRSSRTTSNKNVITDTLEAASRLQKSDNYTSDIEAKVDRVIATISSIELSDKGQKLYDSIRKLQE